MVTPIWTRLTFPANGSRFVNVGPAAAVDLQNEEAMERWRRDKAADGARWEKHCEALRVRDEKVAALPAEEREGFLSAWAARNASWLNQRRSS